MNEAKDVQLLKEVSKLSFENAEQWIRDAKLLIEDKSHAHARALLSFACEEIVKGFVCWIASEKLWPLDSKSVKDVFRNHVAKNQVILALSLIHLRKHFGLKELKDSEIIDVWRNWKEYPGQMEIGRQDAIYVGLKNGKISVPKINETQVVGVLRGVEVLLKEAKELTENLTESEKESLRKYFLSWPKEVWKTGKVPAEWFEKISEDKEG